MNSESEYIMQRRTFIKNAALSSLLIFSPCISIAEILDQTRSKIPDQEYESYIKDRLVKKKLYDQNYADDIILDEKFLSVLKLVCQRLTKIQSLAGYGNFCLLNFDEAIQIAKNYPKIGLFTKQELDFMEMIFYSKGKDYGFMGDKPITKITGKINKKEVKKISGTGNYLYQGKPLERYYKIQNEIGNDVILTSGVRSVVKQFLLFLNKTKSSNGNLSMASRSLAPPGYSFHGIGDFDVGKKGYGIHNFTEKFTQTTVYQRLSDLGYVKFRYEQDNQLGVRFEPWHIEV